MCITGAKQYHEGVLFDNRQSIFEVDLIGQDGLKSSDEPCVIANNGSLLSSVVVLLPSSYLLATSWAA